MKHALLKQLQFTAAKRLHRTRSVPQSLQKSDKFTLLDAAYGRAAVIEDFEAWCDEHKTNPPKYPITEYLRVVDDRLGQPTDEVKVDLDDPGIQLLAAKVYDLSGFTPSRKQLADLLAVYSENEIIDAFREFVETLDDSNHKSGMKKFFGDGGCAMIIFARKHRNEVK